MAPDQGEVSAPILNAAYMVRHYGRPGAERLRAAALERMATEVLRALAAGKPAELVLYAVAVGLHDRRDRRFD